MIEDPYNPYSTIFKIVAWIILAIFGILIGSIIGLITNHFFPTNFAFLIYNPDWHNITELI